LIVTAALVSWRLFLAAGVRRRSIQMVDDSIASEAFVFLDDESEGWLAIWLSRAGYRDPSAVSMFLAATAGLAAFSLICVVILDRVGANGAMVQELSRVPGGYVDIFALVAKGGRGHYCSDLHLHPNSCRAVRPP
jgi:hypothetical protein